MTRSHKIGWLVLAVTLLFVLWRLPRLHGQGFGSFSHDQPFFAADRSTTFTPESIANMVFWLDPYSLLTNDVGGTPADGAEIFVWGDKGPNSFYFTNYNGVGLVYHSSGGPTNGPHVTSSGVSSCLVMNDDRHWNQPNTVFLVMKQDDTTARYYFDTTNSSYRNSIRITTSKLNIQAGATLTAPNTWDTSGGWVIVTAQYNGVSSLIRTNGALNVSGDANPDPASRPRLGPPDGNTGGDYMAEYIMYNSLLSSNQMRQVEEYLGTKYGISVP